MRFPSAGLAFALILSGAACASRASSLAWERTVQEVAAKPGQEVVNFDFPFRNTGGAAVTIVSAEGSCRCLAVEVPAPTVASGAEGHVLVAFSVGGARAVQEKSVTVVTDEPGRVPVTLVLRVAPPATG